MNLLLNPASLLSWALQSTLLLGMGWLFYALLLRQERCFRFNRWVLLSMPWLAVLVPLALRAAGPALAAWQSAPDGPGALLPSRLLPELTVHTAPGAPGPTLEWLPAIYGAGVAALLALLLGRVLRVWYTTRQFPREARAGYVLVHTHGQRPVGSFGRWVFWPGAEALTPAEAAAVLAHEVAHVRQHHTLARLSLEVARALLWFNPFVHVLPRALAQVHEFLADEAALQTTEAAAAAGPADYAALLARQALRNWQPALPLAHSFTQSLTLLRIRMLTANTPVRRWKQWLLLPLSLGMIGLLACEQQPEALAPAAATTPDQARPVPPAPPAVYNYVEQMPEYQGGMTQLMADLGRLVQYPAAAQAEKREAKVFVSFIITADGAVQAAEVVKGAESGTAPTPGTRALNAAALRAVQQLSGHWQPGRQNGQPVAVKFTIPITFALKKPGN